MKAKKAEDEIVTRIAKERQPLTTGGELRKETKAQKLDLNEAKRESFETGKLFDNATQTYGAALSVKFDVQDAVQKEENKLEVELAPKKKIEIESTVKYLYETPTEMIKMVKFSYNKFAEADVKADAEPENQELRTKAATLEKEYSTYKAQIKVLKDKDAKEAELDAEYGEPEEKDEAESEDRKVVIPPKEIEKITKQAKEVFEKGEEAIVQAQKDSFKKFMKLELQFKANEELLDIKEEADMEKQKFELLKEKIAFVRKEDAFINP
jgi:hypothetical protein